MIALPVLVRPSLTFFFLSYLLHRTPFLNLIMVHICFISMGCLLKGWSQRACDAQQGIWAVLGILVKCTIPLPLCDKHGNDNQEKSLRIYRGKGCKQIKKIWGF